MPAPRLALLVLVIAGALTACRPTTTYLPKAPIRFDAPSVTLRVKKALVHYGFDLFRPHSFEIQLEATAKRTIQLGHFWLTPPMDQMNIGAFEGEEVLLAGETKHFVVNDPILADSRELPAIQVGVIDGSETLQLRVPLVDREGDPLLRPVRRIFGAVTIGGLWMVQPRDGLRDLGSGGLGVSSDFGPVRVRMGVDVASSTCDPDICPKTGESPRVASGAGARAGIEMLPVHVAPGYLGDHLRFGAELRYGAYRLSQPRATGDEVIWMHGPVIVPKIVIGERGVPEAGLDPGRGPGLDFGLPIGLLWSGGRDTRPSFAMGFSMLFDL